MKQTIFFSKRTINNYVFQNEKLKNYKNNKENNIYFI
jgi:hypothetical protein